MHFFFDESGNFSPPSDMHDHQVSVAVGLAVSDVAFEELRTRFDKFEKGRTSRERCNGEVKGHLLSAESRTEFCHLLSSIAGISLTPVTLDLSSLPTSFCEKFTVMMRERLTQSAELMAHKRAREEMSLIARQCGNLSTSQGLRIYTWSYCISQAVRHALIFLSAAPHANSWLTPRFELDPVQVKPGNREERVASILIFAWLWGWSIRQPFTLVKEIHTPEHPFMRKYDNGSAIDISKLIRRNLYWVRSSKSWGIRVADIAANIVYSAAMDLDDRNGNVSLYASLMQSSFYGHVRGPGLFTPLSDLSGQTTGKYSLLSAAMKINRA